jgi:hypothetical protein
MLRGSAILSIVVESVEPERLGRVMGLLTPLLALAAQLGALVACGAAALGAAAAADRSAWLASSRPRRSTSRRWSAVRGWVVQRLSRSSNSQ